MSRAEGEGAAAQSRRPIAMDALCLAAITIVSALPYLPHLGFYSDDWGMLPAFEAAQRSGSMARFIADFFAARPVQGIYLAGLFLAFGFDPLGYHLVNTAVLAASAALLYLLLARMGFGRPAAFGTTLLFLMLPQLTTVRVWYATFQIPLSLALMLVSMHFMLFWRRGGGAGWIAGALAAAAASIAAYEIFAPLLAAFALALGFERVTATSSPAARRRAGLLLAATVLGTAIAGGALKLMFGGRSGFAADPGRYLAGLRQLVRPDYDWRVDSSLNIFAMARAHFWAPVRGWWSGAAMLAEGRVGWFPIVLGIVIATLAWWRLSDDRAAGRRRDSQRLLLAGIAAFLLGHAIFVLVPAITFPSTGIGNRVHVAAAIGVAMIFAGLLILLSRLFPPPLRPRAFSVMTVIITFAAFLRMWDIERYWAEAPRLQQRVLDAARADLRSVPANSTIILDGVCPFHGPAIVFDSYWDFRGALSVALRRPMDGDVVSPRLRITPHGLETSIYGERTLHPFGPRLFVYDPFSHRLAQLRGEPAARAYFAAHRPLTCPGFVARGAEV